MGRDSKKGSGAPGGAGGAEVEPRNDPAMLTRLKLALQRRQRERAAGPGADGAAKGADGAAAKPGADAATPGADAAATLDPQAVVAEMGALPPEPPPADAAGGAPADTQSKAQELHAQILDEVKQLTHAGEGVAQSLKDKLVDLAGESVGVAEMVGLKYPVKAYEAQVSSVLFRGSRVDDQGMASLAAQGVHGVVSFCAENDNDTPLAAKYGLHALHLAIMDNSPPSFGQVHQFLNFVNDGANQPVYCHCEAGKGRTGTMVACYRMASEGWTLEAALAEAKSFGLAMPNQIEFLHKFSDALKSGEF